MQQLTNLENNARFCQALAEIYENKASRRETKHQPAYQAKTSRLDPINNTILRRKKMSLSMSKTSERWPAVLMAVSGTILVVGLVASLVACSGGNDNSAAPIPRFTIGGTVSGLAGSGLVLQNNAGDDLNISADGNFTFATSLANGGTYTVTVMTQPKVLSQTCTVSNGIGTVTALPVSNVVVSCVTPPPRFAYTANSNMAFGVYSISAFTVNAATGALTPVAGSPFTTGGAFPSAVTVDPTGKFAYVTHQNSDDISAFTIDTITGALTPVAGSPFATESYPHSVAVDPTGKFAYVSSSLNVSAYSIDATTGALTLVPGSPFATGGNAWSVAVDPTGSFVYVANGATWTVSAYSIDAATGALTAVVGSPFAAGASPQSIAVDPTGKFAYTANSAANNITAFTINAATGALTTVAGSPFAAGNAPYSVTVDPKGKFVYVPNVNSSNVSVYTINNVTGALTPVAGSPFADGTQPWFVAVDPTGKFAYTANQNSSNVSANTIDAATGALTPVTGSPFAAGGQPISLIITR
jgi:6-phosphogluconolactonase (cycloisomerase 2 family)